MNEFNQSFYDDEEKMQDFHTLGKERFLESYSYLNESEYEATKAEVEEKVVGVLVFPDEDNKAEAFESLDEFKEASANALLQHSSVKVIPYTEEAKTVFKETAEEVAAELRADAKEDIPYVHNCGYAKENNEIEKYKENRRSNEECVEAIKSAIKQNTEYANYGKYVDLPKALTDVLETQSLERVAFITASTIAMSEHDGRYDASVKNWAKDQYAELDEIKPMDFALHDNDGTCHPTVFNSFAKTVMAEQFLRESISNTIDAVERFYAHSDEYTTDADLEKFAERDIKGIMAYAADINNYQACHQDELSNGEIREAREAVAAVVDFATALRNRGLSDEDRNISLLKGEISILDEGGNAVELEAYQYKDSFENALDKAISEHGTDHISVNDYTSTCVYAQKLQLLKEEQNKPKAKRKTDVER